MTRFSRLDLVALSLGFSFLYLPILIVIVFSFNASRLVTVWGGFSTAWYGSLLANTRLVDSLFISLQVAAFSATLATVLGTMAALAMVRVPQFPARALFAALILAPVVMPEVITGISLLLFFVAIGFDRGFWTVTLAHATFTLGFVAIIVRARLASMDPLLEEAAADLGADPRATFLLVTLPLLAPAVIAGWLLAFTLSLDDLVIASFNTGPGASTLPMRIYSQVRLGVTPEINAISTVLIGAVALIVLIGSFALRRR